MLAEQICLNLPKDENNNKAVSGIRNNDRGNNQDEMQRILQTSRVLDRKAFYLNYWLQRVELDDQDDDKDAWEQDDNEGETSEKKVLEFCNEFNLIHDNNPYTKYLWNLNFPVGGVSNTQGCSYCLHKKPNRTHHCRICKACVLKGDHHCDFLASCIGYGNYKQFILMLFYLTITNIFVIITSIQTLKSYLLESSKVTTTYNFNVDFIPTNYV